MSGPSLKIAVVGSGIAGLSVGWLLSQKHQVTLYERHSRPGMGAHNLEYQEGDVDVQIDVPIRAFNSCYYKNLIALYRLMGVEFLRTDHSATYTVGSDFLQAKNTYFGYRYLNIGSRAIPVFASLSKINLKSLVIVKEAARFLWQANRDLRSGRAQGLTIEEYLELNRYSDLFTEHVIYPSFAAIGTCSYDAVKRYPASLIIEFLASGMLFDGIWRAKFGAADPIGRMIENCHEVRCLAQVASIRKRNECVEVLETNGKLAKYDHVVIASQANQAVSLLAEDEAEAASLLAQIPYEKSEVVVHGDTSLVPSRSKDQAPVNFLVDANKSAPMASICLNDLYPALRGASPLFQTWNPLIEPSQNSVIGRSTFERPVVTLDSLAAINKLNELHQESSRQVWYCGSYAMPGIPLLESAVQSAMSIAQALDCDIPWI